MCQVCNQTSELVAIFSAHFSVDFYRVIDVCHLALQTLAALHGVSLIWTMSYLVTYLHELTVRLFELCNLLREIDESLLCGHDHVAPFTDQARAARF